ncbi:MAG: nucleotidyltransferase domain-containing protein [Planctomycetes bacterium]|nr:nucleotidyltransferase domain-containing protein [Planctomycetota bacterium]MBU4397944.1 nucleotidyltransferase domain-containing protein [Planctomycetota bacterium]MCG2685168.1 nucleotidyltransferase domain-containing protein [Planctomycetales bacterium]
MVSQAIDAVVRQYLRALAEAGIHARRAVLFGSHAKGTADEWSDIDLVVIAPELEPPAGRRLVNKLWELRATTDSRVEPIPCGEREWETDDSRPILEIARREGILVNG